MDEESVNRIAGELSTVFAAQSVAMDAFTRLVAATDPDHPLREATSTVAGAMKQFAEIAAQWLVAVVDPATVSPEDYAHTMEIAFRPDD